MFGSQKRQQRVQRVIKIDDQLENLTDLVKLVDAGHLDSDHQNPYYVIQQVEMISYVIFDSNPIKDATSSDKVMCNVGECLMQLVILTLLSLKSSTPVSLLKIQEVIMNRYPVSQLDSKFEFQNDVLNLQRLHLMDVLKTVLVQDDVLNTAYQLVVYELETYQR